MMKRYTTTRYSYPLLLTLLLAFAPKAGAQTPEEHYLGSVTTTATPEVSRTADSVTLYMELLLDDLTLESNDRLRLTPALRMRESGEVRLLLPPVTLEGRKREIVSRRQGRTEPEGPTLRRYNGTALRLPYSAKIAREEWMKEAELVLLGVTEGCADCLRFEEAKPLLTPFLREPYEPQFTLSYITPEVEPVKARSDRHTATFNFVVARHELRRDYKDNAAQLDSVDSVVREVLHNTDLTVTEFAITGYASPEGGYEYNRALAGRRAASFSDYLGREYGIDRSRFTSTGHGEDWEGLAEAVRASSLPRRDEVLAIIDETPSPDARDAKLRAIDGGVTYRELLDRFYPPLRRTEYVIAYNVRPFNPEEGREIIKTNPKLLSLNEMYLVALTYPAGSPEWKEVFDIAVRLYPDQPVAILNSAAADIEAGNLSGALTRLARLGETAEALNNIAVAYARSDDIDRAEETLRRAIDLGSDDARHNLEELTRFRESL